MKKRKYKPKPLLADPIAHAIAGAAVTDRKSLDQIRMRELSALESMIRGDGTIGDWKTLVDLLNIAETMGRNGIGPEVLPVCERVQTSMIKTANHYEKTGRMVLDGLGIQAIRELIEYADLQQSSIPRAEFERMIRKTAHHIASSKNVYAL